MTEIKLNQWYSFDSKEDYIDFLETVERETDLKWSCGSINPTAHYEYYIDGEFSVYTDNRLGLCYSTDYKPDAIRWIPSKQNKNEGETKLKFKTGNKVYVKCGYPTDVTFGVSDDMKAMEGKLLEVKYVTSDGAMVSVYTEYKGRTYPFHPEDVSFKPFGNVRVGGSIPINIEKIIFNNPATILYANGERYVSKSYNETFDEEKGLALTLLKAFGISYLDLQRMIKGATKQNKKEKSPKTPVAASKSAKVVKKRRKRRPEETEEVTNENGERYTIHKGKRKGIPQRLQQGDRVLVRLCKMYDYEEIEVVRELIGKPLMVDYVGLDSVIVFDGERRYEFSRNELDKIVE